MTLSNEQVHALIHVLDVTEEDELDCEEVLIHLAQWSERILNGEKIENADKKVKHHLMICSECREEFNLLLEILKSDQIENDPQ